MKVPAPPCPRGPGETFLGVVQLPRDFHIIQEDRDEQ